MTGRRRALVLVAVGVAFADSSIVVLAVPELLPAFDVSVSRASWAITAYNLAVLAAAAALLPLLPRIGTRALAGVGFAGFGLASLGCALASSFDLLVGLRAAQGAAAALVLVAALPLLGGRPGVVLWTSAATLGLAAGPALGGVLTELFSWRSIFAVQAPLGAAGLLALRRPAPGAPLGLPERRGRSWWLANATLAALSGALVGALFLVVVLLVNGFGWQPLPAALAATALPALALAAELLGRGLPAAVAASTGGLLVAAGLAVLGLLPGARTELVVAGLALCGAGLGLAAQPLGRLALAGPRPSRDAAWTVVARHAGLVAALLVATPVLVASLDELETEAEAVGGELVLRAPIPLEEKVPLLLDLVRAAESAESALPDLEATLAPYETGTGTVAALAERLEDEVHDLVARSFREPFLVCAGFGLLAALLGLGLGGRGRLRAPAVGFVLVACAGAALALGAAHRLGALDEPAAASDPCDAPPSAEGRGFAEAVDRIALGALASAACDLGTSRAALLRAVAGSGSTRWTDDQLGRALRLGVVAAIDAERERGTIDGTVALLLRTVAANAPLDWIRDALRGLAEG